jgi:hypothetical protein
MFNECITQNGEVRMFRRASNIETARKLLVKEVLKNAPLYYEQIFDGTTFYGVGVDRDGSVHGFGCADNVEGIAVEGLSLFDLGGLLENDDPERLFLFEMRKREQERNVQTRLW